MPSSERLDVPQEFRHAMASVGIVTRDCIVSDGRLHRVHVEGDRQGSRNGWYVLHCDPPVGSFGSWKLQIRESWSAAINRKKKLTREEFEEQKRRRDEAVASQRAETDRRESKARAEAEAIWRNAEPAPAAFPYLLSKKIGPNGSMCYKGRLVLPVRDADNTLQSLQFISGSGEKRFHPGGRTAGCCYAVGELRKRAFVCEGFATGASIYEASGDCVFIAFHAGNLLAVAKAIRKKCPRIELIIAADNDQWTDGNPGRSKAIEAATATGAKVAIPRFRNTETRPTDFNDLSRLEGVVAVKEQLGRAFVPGKVSSVPERRRLKVISLSDVEAKQQRYLWPDYLPDNQLIAIYGPSHTAKSVLALDLGARITSGLAWPDGSPNIVGPRKVLILSAGEDAVDTVLKPRFALAGGDPSRLQIIVGSIPMVREGEIPGPIDEEMVALDCDLDLIEAILEADRDIALVIIDPVTNHLGSRKPNVEEEVRPVLMRLKRMAENLCVPVIIIGHLNRRVKGTAALDRMLGARAFSGVPRTIYVTGPDSQTTENQKHHFIWVQERGLGAKGWRYQTQLQGIAIDGAECRQIKILWDIQADLTGEDAVDPLTKEEKSREQEAAEALVEFLQQRGGAADKSECIQHLNKYGGVNFSRVRERADVESDQRNNGKFGKAVWRLCTTGGLGDSVYNGTTLPKNNTVNSLYSETYTVVQAPAVQPVIQISHSERTTEPPPSRKPYKPGISPFTGKPYPPAYSTYRPGGKEQ